MFTSWANTNILEFSFLQSDSENDNLVQIRSITLVVIPFYVSRELWSINFHYELQYKYCLLCKPLCVRNSWLYCPIIQDEKNKKTTQICYTLSLIYYRHVNNVHMQCIFCVHPNASLVYFFLEIRLMSISCLSGSLIFPRLLWNIKNDITYLSLLFISFTHCNIMFFHTIWHCSFTFASLTAPGILWSGKRVI